MKKKYEEKYVFWKEDIEKNINEESIFISDDIDFEIDLSVFKNLKELRIQCKKFKNIDTLQKLEYLNIMSLKKRHLDELSKLENLKRIDITQGNVENLDFIKAFNKLEILEINYLNKLTGIEGLVNLKESIIDLSINSCKLIKNLKPIEFLVNLKELSLIKVPITDIAFINNLVDLKKLLIMNTSILSQDLKPASKVPWVSIDNKTHYNYYCDFDQYKLFIKKEVNKNVDTLISTSYFGDLDLANLKDYYEDEIVLEKEIITIDLNFENTTISKSKLDILKHVFSYSPSDIRQGMIDTLKTVPNHESIVLYREFLEEELEFENSDVEVFLDSLQLKRIGFYPESNDAVVVFDFQPPDLEIDHILCMRMDSKTMIIDISIES